MKDVSIGLGQSWIVDGWLLVYRVADHDTNPLQRTLTKHGIWSLWDSCQLNSNGIWSSHGLKCDLGPKFTHLKWNHVSYVRWEMHKNPKHNTCPTHKTIGLREEYRLSHSVSNRFVNCLRVLSFNESSRILGYLNMLF